MNNNLVKRNYTILVVVTLIQFYSCGPKKSSETPIVTDTITSNKSEDARERDLVTVLGNAEYHVLRNCGEAAYSVSDPDVPGNFIFPQFIESKIKLGDFKNFFRKTDQGNFEGIRIYPGYVNASNEMILIACQANLTDDKEANYIILNNDDFTNVDPFPDAINDTIQVAYLHRDYLSMVKIFFHDQNAANTSIKSKLKYSRFYKASELDELINDNLKNIPEPYDGYKIQFEFGYINSEFVEKLQGRTTEKYTDDELQGFTVMAHIKDPSDKRLIDPTAIYQQNDPQNYEGRYLEVGHPCPPRCGVLHQ